MITPRPYSDLTGLHSAALAFALDAFREDDLAGAELWLRSAQALGRAMAAQEAAVLDGLDFVAGDPRE